MTLSLLPAEAPGPAPELSVGDALRRAARLAPQTDGLVELDGGRWTYPELLAACEGVARALLTRFEPGERVALCSPNRSELVLLQFGAALAGLELVPVNPTLRPAELGYVLRQSGAVGAVLAPEHRGHDLPATVADLRAELPALRDVVVLGEGWDALLAGAGDAGSLPAVDPGAVAQIQYTSGTTGAAKGVVITHRAMTVTAASFCARLGMREGGAWVNPMPLFHTASNVLGSLGAAWTLAPHVILPWTPEGTLRAVAQERATLLSASPTLLHVLLEHPDLAATDTSTVEVIFTGGSVVEPAFVRRVEAAFGARLCITFGMTETCGSALLTSPHDSDEDRETTVGRPIAWTDVMIAGAGGSTPLPLGERGELCLRGVRVTPGYHDMPEETARALDAEGWLHSGDLATMDARGYVRIEGRLKDMIKRGGENIAPAEVEAVLAEHPGVAEAAVVGLPDEKWGETVVAFVRPVAGAARDADALVAHCREHLASYKLPRRWAFLDEMPLTASGKIRRVALRERAAEDPAALIVAPSHGG